MKPALVIAELLALCLRADNGNTPILFRSEGNIDYYTCVQLQGSFSPKTPMRAG
jgi:hypothetical protein